MQQGIDLQTGANLPDIGAGIEMEVGVRIDDVQLTISWQIPARFFHCGVISAPGDPILSMSRKWIVVFGG